MIIVQSRFNSKRLPGKALKKINGVELIKRVYLRIIQLKQFKNKVIIAIPKTEQNIKLKKFLDINSIPFFEGDENNVFNRYYSCVKKLKLKFVVRINGDSPLIDARLIKKIIELSKKNNNFDIITNIYPRSYPVGQSIELIPLSTFRKLKNLKLSTSHKEHVTKYIYDNPTKFRIINFKSKKDLSNYRMAVDYMHDYKLISNFIKKNQINFKTSLKEMLKYEYFF